MQSTTPTAATCSVCGTPITITIDEHGHPATAIDALRVCSDDCWRRRLYRVAFAPRFAEIDRAGNPIEDEADDAADAIDQADRADLAGPE